MPAGFTTTSMPGGAYGTDVTYGAAPAALRATPAHIYNVQVQDFGKTAITIYDNASAASGTILLTIPAATQPGTTYRVEADAANGIYVSGGADAPHIFLTHT